MDPAPGAAQTACSEDPSQCGAPTITLSPASGSWTGESPTAAQPQAVELDICDATGVQMSTLSVTLDGVQVPLSHYEPAGRLPGCVSHYTAGVSLTLRAGTNTLRAQVRNTSGVTGSATGSYSYTYHNPVAVTPDGTSRSVTIGQSVTESFTVRNAGKVTHTFGVEASCSRTGVSGCTTAILSVTLAPGASAVVPVSYRAPDAADTTGVVWLKAWKSGEESVRDSGWVRLKVSETSSAYRIDVAAPASSSVRGVSSSVAEAFTVTNQGTVTTAYAVQAVCSGAASGCALGVDSVWIAPGGTAAVSVTYRTSTAAGATGTVLLKAFKRSYPGQVRDSAAVSVRLVAAPGTRGAVSQAGDQTRLDRGACVASGVYECGDLRLAQGVAATRVLNRAAAPTLIYSSQHARPYPVVAAHVQLPASSRATKVRLTLRGASGAVLAVQEVGAWTAGQTRRVAVGFDASDPSQYPTGLYPYTLSVDTVGATGTGVLRSETGTLAVVNRSRSRFGAGWWIAGLEQLHVPGSDTTARLWVGGNGSTRVYRKRAPRVWTADAYDRPDTLRYDSAAQQYVRVLPGRAEVRYNRLGLHVRTRGRTGLYSDFEWQGDTILTRLHLVRGPSFSSGQFYSLAYSGGRLDSISAPGARALRITMDASRRVTRFRNPDGGTTDYAYADATGRITRLTDALQYKTDFRYDAASRLSAAKLWMQTDAGSTSDSLVTRYQAAEGLGIAGPVAESDVYTLVNGPRADALPDGPGGAARADLVRFYLNRYGVPDSTSDPRGQKTRVERRDPNWPALVTRVASPGPGMGLRRADNTLRADSVQVMLAAYDANGRLVSQTDSSTIVGGRAATTSYTWHPVWDAVASTTSPEGETTEIGYNSLGEREWEQAGPEPGRRVHYRYYPIASANAPGLVRAVQSPLRTDTLIYDVRGNLTRTHNYQAYPDQLGQDTLRVTAENVRTRLRYDVMGRPTRQTILGRDSVVVANVYDALGRTTSTTRRMYPDPSSIGEMAESWTYDAAGRVLTGSRGGGTENTYYDPAGGYVAVMSRRSDHLGGRLNVRTEYDVMGRMVRRISTPVNYQEEVVAAGSSRWTLPGHYQAKLIPGDTATFTYDALGNVLTANNQAAKITRAYLPSGAMESETQEIADNSQSTAYTFSYRYDLSGRLVRVRYPRALAYVSGSTVRDSVTYVYAPRSGDLSRVLDLEGNAFDFFYDGAGMLSAVQKPGGISEGFGYDHNGHVVTQTLAIDNAYVGSGEHELAGGHTESIDRGEDGKVKGVAISDPAFGRRDVSSTYDAFGALQSFDYGLHSMVYEERDLVSDPLGNVRYERRRDILVGTQQENGNAYRIVYDSLHYTSGTGRLAERLSYTDDSPRGLNGQITQYDASEWYRYDHEGNQVWSKSVAPMGGETGGPGDIGSYEVQRTKQLWTYSYYDALNQLRYTYRVGCVLAVERGSNSQTAACEPWSNYPEMEPGVSQVFRYDALGRRVFVSAAYEAGCLHGCESYEQHTVWSGDQVAGELRGTAMKVAYTHGVGIDQPLSLLRHGLTTTPFTVVPHANWRGMYQSGTFVNGSVAVGPINLRSVEWPAANAGAYMNPLQLEPVHTRYTWMGSLLTSSRDASGLMYRRNRYYDPATGRFTQEDPIGIAGGLNLYAFGGGDPVSYSDPYGLCPKWLNNVRAMILCIKLLGSFEPFVDPPHNDLDNTTASEVERRESSTTRESSPNDIKDDLERNRSPRHPGPPERGRGRVRPRPAGGRSQVRSRVPNAFKSPGVYLRTLAGAGIGTGAAILTNPTELGADNLAPDLQQEEAELKPLEPMKPTLRPRPEP